MPPRLFVDHAIAAADRLDLPARAARHAQVLRLQPGAPVTLFDGGGGEWSALIAAMDRRAVQVQGQAVAQRGGQALLVGLFVSAALLGAITFLVEGAMLDYWLGSAADRVTIFVISSTS